MTNIINVQHIPVRRCYPQGAFFEQRNTNPARCIGMHRPRWKCLHITFLKYIKLLSMKLQCCDIRTL